MLLTRTQRVLNNSERSGRMSDINISGTVMPGTMFDSLPPLPKDAAVTMAYVPFQVDKSRFDDDEALCKGTLFRELNKPFLRGAFK